MQRYTVGMTNQSGAWDDPEPTMVEDGSGKYVLHSEAQAEISRLQAELEEWKEYGKDKTSQLVIEQAAALNLRAENAALKEIIDDLPDYIEAFRTFKERGCKSRRDYAQVVEDIVGIAREAKDALK